MNWLKVAVLLVGAGALAGGEARANGFAQVNISNPTNTTLTYSYRWGSGEWNAVRLYPGESMLHSWAYDEGSRSSPTFQIRFDCSLDSDVVFRTYTLERYG